MMTFTGNAINHVSGCRDEKTMKSQVVWQMRALSVAEGRGVDWPFNRYARWNRNEICGPNDFSSRLPAGTNLVPNDFNWGALCISSRYYNS
ncbi:hypothetical protein CEXT_451521 [Caerostris extrusa]|uniref:Uncharacterized protein n=1 Tax=Caerostris extrusa TaxID=172846 RepID=A0AAV4VG68_CAEEX|nr:hypothetical protein CEXT_451521 [Caerostris extrusa]